MEYLKVGEVIFSDSACFQWTIDDFLSYAWRNKTLRSPLVAFPYCSLCHISLKFSKPDDTIGIEFWGHVHERPLDVKLRMRTGYGGKRETRSGKTDTNGSFAVGVWMTCSEFLQSRREILTDGRLTVFCEVRALDMEEKASVLQIKLPNEEKDTVEKEASEEDSDEEETSTEGKTLKKLQKDLKNLLISGDDCDVTIKVQGKEFPAHRGILRSRSPVFKSMFSHEMVEKQRGVVVIDDCDPVTFPDFLNFVYTGSIEHISDENVFSLYAAADKYGVEGLGEECVAFMKDNISVGTFCEAITLALRHSEKELIDLATEFFCANLTEITATAKWQAFLRENSTVGNLILKLSQK